MNGSKMINMLSKLNDEEVDYIYNLVTENKILKKNKSIVKETIEWIKTTTTEEITIARCNMILQLIGDEDGI